MLNNKHRTFLDKKGIKIFARTGDSHCELNYDYKTISHYHDLGWNVYAINTEGIFFFINNIGEDGYDWYKIIKRENK